MNTLEYRFKNKVTVKGRNECWPWTAGTDKKGYGRIWAGKEREESTLQAHRVAWELANGKPPPKGKLICHTCDNPPCCNDIHLFVGTHQDNMNDMTSKTRQVQGQNKVESKLADSDISMILLSKKSNADLARKFKVNRSTIRKIRSGKSWTHVDKHISRPVKGFDKENKKLCVDEVKKIRECDKPHKVIAKEFSISEATVSQIKNRRTWKNVI